MLALHSPQEAAAWLRARVHGALRTDSRQVQAGDGFIAWPGAATDGRAHVADALRRGAAACLVERDGVEAFAFDDATVASYVALKAASGPIAAAYYADPSQALRVLAVTGTNGKTSTSWWLAQALSTLPAPLTQRCAVVGTLGVGVPPLPGCSADDPLAVVSTGLTTPDPVLLQQSFRRFVDAGFAACAIEASSIGIVEQRLDGTSIHTALLTNLTQDHLDYHGDMASYWQAKRKLFAWPGLRAAVVNVDDAHGEQLANSLREGALDLWTVSCREPARLHADDIRYGERGLTFDVHEGADTHRLQTALIGHYNVSNVLVVLAGMRTLGVPLAAAAQACQSLTPVPGRMQCLGAAGQPLVVVDYAHTPDALDKALSTLHALAQQRGGRLWCVFGCGGDRDPIKRPLMGAVAARHADRIVVTSDNPRGERAQAIISQILLGVTHDGSATVQSDRALAIAQSVAQAGPLDVVLVAGKGHEDYQEVAGVRRPFSDVQQVGQALAVWPAPAPRQDISHE
ncbi:MAG: UDP-N-acetylmuramoyl-L-alanyl-D-glutamate--2,6-diaminopimelate ligase [Rhodoferax sp.]|nr:UDP-N-acetylmuramoyl-L-alanyl-D-glutamate--2,6-diaminopimelate ligase [Rhodoferax sp.]MBK9235853.1 UDP-N-acetylmuramoyl-L-alanyl-D-glutamate--2,6-diaminopimelate ligase [Rhodoferax sp.]